MSSNKTSVVPETAGRSHLSNRAFAVVLGAVLVTLNLGAIWLVLEQRHVVDAQLGDIARKGVALEADRGKAAAEVARGAAAAARLAEVTGQIDAQTIAMERQRVEQRDLDQRKRERDAAIAERDEAGRAQRDAELARDRAHAEARAADNILAVARDTLQTAQADVTRLNTMRSGLQSEIDRLQRDRPLMETAARKAEDDRKTAEAQAQQAVQGRDDARRLLEAAQRERDAANDSMARAKAELASLENRRSDASGALQRLDERRRLAIVDAEAEEARLKRARDELAAQKVEVAAGQQRQEELRKGVVAAQAAATDSDTQRGAALQELGAVQAQLAGVKVELTNLEARRTDASSVLLSLDERRRVAAVNADAEETRLKKARDELAAQQGFIAGGQQREEELRKRLQAAQIAATSAESRLFALLQEVGNVQGQLGVVRGEVAMAKQDQARLPNLRTEIRSAIEQLASLQQQQAPLQTSLTGGRAQLTKIQTEIETLNAEVRSLMTSREQLQQAVQQNTGQRSQLGNELKALNEEIGQRRADVARLRIEADQALTARQVALAEQAVIEQQRAQIMALIPGLQARRNGLQEELAATLQRAAEVRASLERMLRERDNAEREIARLREHPTASALPLATPNNQDSQ